MPNLVALQATIDLLRVGFSEVRSLKGTAIAWRREKRASRHSRRAAI
jgi:hypothetical protein